MPLLSFIPDRTLDRLQAVSGLTFASFLSLHLTTHLSTHFGWDEAHSVLRLVRHYYQNPIVEPLIVASALVHAGSGAIKIIRRQQNRVTGDSANAYKYIGAHDVLHRYAGYVLLAAFPGHFLATRAIPLSRGVPVDLSFITLSLEIFRYTFPVYYLVFGAAGLYHMLLGTQKALRNLGFGIKSVIHSENFRVIAGVSGLLFASVVMAYKGVYYNIPMPHREEYISLAKQYLPEFLMRDIEGGGLKATVVSTLRSIPETVKQRASSL